MKDEIEHIYKKIKEKLNNIEKEYCNYLIYKDNMLIEYKSIYKKDTLSLNIKLKENRKTYFLIVLDELKIKYKIVSDNEYYTMIELEQNKNYILIDYVVDSHIIIPQSFLERFGYKTKDGKKITFINIKKMQIESEKIKKYGAEYGYYSKKIEEILNHEFEKEIGEIRRKIHSYIKQNKKIITFPNNEMECIYNFFSITTYRNPKVLQEFNRKSIVSAISGECTHSQLINMALSEKYNIYKCLKFNLMINFTDIDFIINDTLISSIYYDGWNEIMILPISKKECLTLMDEDYYKKYVVNGRVHAIGIEKESDVQMINKYIFKEAIRKGENVIGNRKELEILLQEMN